MAQIPLAGWVVLASAAMALQARAEAHAAAPGRIVSATAADLFEIADRSLKRGERLQAERLLVILSRDPNSEVRNEARFRHAALLAEGGQQQEAAVLLRRILDERPEAVPVRLKLAALLQGLGDQEAAFRELRAVQSADLPPAVARFVDRMAASMQMSKPRGLQLEIGIAPDSNINRATGYDTVGTIFGDFAIDDKARSGVGLAVRWLAHANRPLGDKATVTARLSGDAALYGEAEYNDIALGLTAGPEITLGRTRLGAEVGLFQQWFGMKPYQRTVKLSGSIVRPLGSVSQVRIEPSLRWVDDEVNDLRDGRGLGVRLRFDRALSPAAGIALTASAERYRAGDPAYSTRSWLVGLSGFRDIGRMTLSAGVEYGRLRADERLLILPSAREDELTRLSLGAVFRHLTVSGFAPTLRFVLERNRSSVEFYDYKRRRTEFGISRAF